jgi:cellulose synthase/poly-beta-1,6-N-acetylglucosamine synthase-like glycosyltransferase
VRRALALINCLPIVSGNIGAFRRSVIDKTGPFLEGFIGEDLELTWRVHKAGFQVNFAPLAVVLAEVPSTVKDLWKQRVRWARGLLQTIRIHKK